MRFLYCIAWVAITAAAAVQLDVFAHAAGRSRKYQRGVVCYVINVGVRNDFAIFGSSCLYENKDGGKKNKKKIK